MAMKITGKRGARGATPISRVQPAEDPRPTFSEDEDPQRSIPDLILHGYHWTFGMAFALTGGFFGFLFAVTVLREMMPRSEFNTSLLVIFGQHVTWMSLCISTGIMFASLAYLRIGRIKITLDAQGISYRGMIFRWRLAWSEIEHITIELKSSSQGLPSPCYTLHGKEISGGFKIDLSAKDRRLFCEAAEARGVPISSSGGLAMGTFYGLLMFVLPFGILVFG